MNALIDFLTEGGELDSLQVSAAAQFLMDDSSPTDTRVAFLKALSEKGETPKEIALFVEEFLKLAVDPQLDDLDADGPTIDVCGTGGDKLDLFNVSTTSMFVIAAGGATVLKHGNRGITSKSGGADVLEALGVRLDLPKDQLRRCVEGAGVGFLFAQAYHPAFKAVAPVRALLAKQGQTSIFNVMGPLLNPARPQCQLVGVANAELLPIFSEILQRLERDSAWVVNGSTADGRGVDEMSLMGPTTLFKSGGLQSQQDLVVTPEELGLTSVTPDALTGGNAQENAHLLRAILSGEERGPKRDMVLLNAAAGLTCAGLSDTLEDALLHSAELIDSGAATARLEKMISLSQA